MIVRHVPEPASQRLLLEKADVDFARDLTPDQIKPLAGNTDIKVESFKAANTFYMGLNLGYEPLANPKVRQAMKMLVDYDGMVKTLPRPAASSSSRASCRSASSAPSPTTPSSSTSPRPRRCWPRPATRTASTVKMAAPNVSPWTEISQSVQQTMGQAGIKVSIEPMELKAVIGQYRGREHQIAMLSWGPDYFDPHTNADTFVHNDDNSDTPKIKPIAWRNKWFIPDITKEMLAAAQGAGHRQARRAIRRAAEEGDGRRARTSSCSRTTTRWRGA